MGLTEAEWNALSFLLKYKLPKENTSIISITDRDHPLLLDIEEFKNLLSSLEKKGIIKLKEFLEVKSGREEATTPEITDPLKLITSLNLLFIAGYVDDEEYDKCFHEIISSIKGDIYYFAPLTLIERFFFWTLSLKALLYDLSKINSYVDLTSIVESLSSYMNMYLDSVKILISENSQEELEILTAYLYPFLKPFIQEASSKQSSQAKLVEFKVTKFNADITEMDKIMKDMKVEEEVINVLTMLEESYEKIMRHKLRLQDLERRLEELQKIMKEKGRITIQLTSTFYNEENIIRDLRNWVNSLIGYYENIDENKIRGYGEIKIIDSIVYRISQLIYRLLKGLRGNPNKTIEIPLRMISMEAHKRQPLEKSKVEKESSISDSRGLVGNVGKHYRIAVPLTWMNDLCPALQDSVLDSNGDELMLCKNPECFVVYHKNCVDKLLQTGINQCLICNSLLPKL